MEKVMLAMSGGVDSSAALLVLRESYEVLGVTLRLYDHEDPAGKTCCSLSDVEDARAVASRFGVMHYVYNFKEKFRRDVIEPFKASYLSGETPNPCIDCNRRVKFDELLKHALALDCRYLATGHYARTELDPKSGRWLLKKAVSAGGANDKDQSYVLYNLTQEQLSHILFPLGGMEKADVRRLAQENGLVNSQKPDSQDICFVPDGDYAGFIERDMGICFAEGDFLDENGAVVGRHRGVPHYTIGQRRGLRLSLGEAVYVTAKNARENTVTVGTGDRLWAKELVARDLNWISIPTLTGEMRVKAKIRYKQAEQPCTIRPLGDRVHVCFDEAQRAAAPGQRVVFYDGDSVVGGGVICSP